jgi:hypothetical protein
MTTTTFTPRMDAELARAELRVIFPPGSTARTVLRHVSRSGMARWISVIGPDGDDVTVKVAAAIGERVHERAGSFCIRVNGCGMDMGFSLVYELSSVLWRDGYWCQIGTDNGPNQGPDYCPSNAHVNEQDWSHADIPHTDGYAVSQRWL